MVPGHLERRYMSLSNVGVILILDGQHLKDLLEPDGSTSLLALL